MRQWLKVGGDYIAIAAIRCIQPTLDGRLEIYFNTGQRRELNPRESAGLRQYFDWLGESGLIADIDKLATASVPAGVGAY